jgi:hypothetical protein
MSLLEQLVHDASIDTFQGQLAAECDLAARPGAVTRLDPRPSERGVIQHPELGQARDRTVDQLRPVARPAQPSANLGDGSGPSFEEAGGRLEDDGRVVDRGSPIAALGK